MIKIAIVGTGGIAHSHAGGLKKLPGCRIVAGVDPDAARLEKYCDRHQVEQRYGDVKSLLRSCDFDAAVVATPDAFHVPCALPLVKAGKHVLCEKPIAPTAPEGRRLVTAARKAGVINMINFSYRNCDAVHHAHKLVASGKLGRLMHLEARYLQAWLASRVWGDWRTTPGWLWRCSSAHGSLGVLGDVGVHIVDLATYVANERVKRVNGLLKTFSKAPGDKIGEYVLDANDTALLRVELEGGAIGTVSATRWATGQVNSLALILYGQKGGLRLDLDRSENELEICTGKDVDTATWKTIKCPKSATHHRRFLRAIRTGKQTDPDFARGWEVQKVLDASFRSDAQQKTMSLRY